MTSRGILQLDYPVGLPGVKKREIPPAITGDRKLRRIVNLFITETSYLTSLGY